MKYISNLVKGKNGADEYAELTDADLNNHSTNQQVAFVNVTSQQDLINAKEELHDGTIVILDISLIESNGLSLEIVYGDIESAIEVTDGDIVHKENNDIIVATPRDIGINRTPI